MELKYSQISGPISYLLMASRFAQLHNSFWSKSGVRMSEFSDVSISLSLDAVTYHDRFEAKYFTGYREEHVDSHGYSGKSLGDRIGQGQGAEV